MLLESAAAGPPRRVTSEELLDLLTATTRFWRAWLARSTYRGRWRQMVDRAAITLKLMTYAPTGALIAAPTAGLPEQIGGERNWDYRYTWVRDGSFSVHALSVWASPTRRKRSSGGSTSASPSRRARIPGR